MHQRTTWTRAAWGMPAWLVAALATWTVTASDLVAADGSSSSPARPQWTYCRGPSSDGVGYDTGLIDDWNPAGGPGSNVRWKRDDLGGRSTPIIYNGRLYTILRAEPGTPREGERVVCLDAASGEILWENRFSVYLSDVPDTRVGWSACVVDPETENVYVQGVCGLMRAIDGKTGETLWTIPMHEYFGLLSTFGGRTNFPVVFEDLVIVSGVVIGWGEMARPSHRIIAFDKRTGQVVWYTGTRPLPEDTTYSQPTIRVIDGKAMFILGSGDGSVWALEPRTGRQIWHYRLSRRGVNAPPLVTNDRVFIGHGEENIVGTTMGAVAAIDPRGTGDITESGELWKVEQLVVGRTAPLLVDGYLWVIDDRAKLMVLNPDTGEAVGRRVALGTVMRATPLYADGKVYAFTENGRWYILASDGQGGVVTKARGRLPSGEEVIASPVCADGRIYLQTTAALYCLEDPTKEHGVAEMPEPARETPVDSDPKPTHLQVVPAELLVRPGQTQQFKVRLFNSHGQFLRESQAEFELNGMGSISSDGTFTAAADRSHHAVYVTARADGLEGTARVRVVPDFPWEFDFEDVALDAQSQLGEPPITWVGARYRHVVREVDGSKVMVKVTTIPKGTRSRCWFGHSDVSNYTITADVRGAIQNGQMPDIGVIAQGYTLDLKGTLQELQIRSWDAQLRMARQVPFTWQPDTWYTMKFQASVEGGRAVLRGKVWPRGEQEPETWTVEAIDEAPVEAGSPGLFGNATDAEIYLDNIRVTANN